MNYSDERGHILGARGQKIENIWVFSALYFILSGKEFSFLPIEDRKISHDEATGKLCSNKPLSWEFVWAYMKNITLWPRDLSFHLNCKWPKVFFWLRPVISLYMIATTFPHKKKPPFYYVWWVKLTCKSEGPPIPDENRGKLIYYYTRKSKNDTVLEYHEHSLDGKTLNILRVYRLKMKWTAKILDKICRKYYGRQYLGDIVFWFLEKDANHPIAEAAAGKSYLNIIR